MEDGMGDTGVENAVFEDTLALWVAYRAGVILGGCKFLIMT